MKDVAKIKTKLLRAKRGVSPVISTVILVAVAITVAVAVAYWMGGIAGQYTRFEKLQIVSAYAVKTDYPSAGWNVTLNVKNTGSSDATFDSVYVNGIPVDDYDPAITEDATDTGTGSPLTLVSGDSDSISVWIDESLFASATTIEVKLHTAAGQDYLQMITLP